MKAMWTKGPPPPELIDLLLCETYHCPPSVLDEQDAERVSRHLVILDVRGKIASMKWQRGAR